MSKCKRCGGSGEIWVVSCQEQITEPCLDCNGTGEVADGLLIKLQEGYKIGDKVGNGVNGNTDFLEVGKEYKKTDGDFPFKNPSMIFTGRSKNNGLCFQSGSQLACLWNGGKFEEIKTVTDGLSEAVDTNSKEWKFLVGLSTQGIMPNEAWKNLRVLINAAVSAEHERILKALPDLEVIMGAVNNETLKLSPITYAWERRVDEITLKNCAIKIQALYEKAVKGGAV